MPKRLELEDLRPEEIIDFEAYMAGELEITKYCQQHRRGHNSIRSLAERLVTEDLRKLHPPDPVTPMIDDDDPVEKSWRYLESYQHDKFRAEDIPWDHDIDFETDLPILVAWIADMHIGHSRSSLRKIRQVLETARDTEGLYVVFGGDDTENTTSSRAHHGAHHEAMMTRQQERAFAEHAFLLPGVDEAGRPKTIGIGEGNHTARSIQDDGASWLKDLCERNNLHYYGYRQRFNLTVGRWEYSIIYAHRHRGGGLDATRPSKKLMEDWGDADAAYTAHTHRAATSEEFLRLQKRSFGVAGSFKDRDDFSGSRGYTPSKPVMPGFVLFPDYPRELRTYFDVFSPRTLREFAWWREYYKKQKKAV